MSPEIVILDGLFANPGDLSWEPVTSQGNTTLYDHTAPEEVVPRSQDADILVVNKIRLDQAHFSVLPKLKLVCISATGMDNVNLEDAKAFGIEVKNAVGYSTNSVAQHVFSFILNFTNQPYLHSASVKQNHWDTSKGFSYTLQPIEDLSGKTIGIYGFGKIGQRVAELAVAFGMRVLVTSRHATTDEFLKINVCDLETLFIESDFISLHAPLTPENKGLLNGELFSKMKKSAYLINTARGGLINESDLHKALTKGVFSGAALDVLAQEPPAKDHPLVALPACIVTPHMAWASTAARLNLIKQVGDNIRNFLHKKSPS